MESLEAKQQDRVTAALTLLAATGAQLGPPYAKKLKGCPSGRLHELIRSINGHEFRILYAFDYARRAIILLGGDKTGIWNDWYPQAIALAEKELAKHDLACEREIEQARLAKHAAKAHRKVQRRKRK